MPTANWEKPSCAQSAPKCCSKAKAENHRGRFGAGKNATIERLLECIPNVSVQGDKVVVFGRGEALIYINGRKMRDKSELDRLTPDNIKDVETILNPGARYPAATKAVVRITTKKPLGEGGP